MEEAMRFWLMSVGVIVCACFFTLIGLLVEAWRNRK